MADMPRGIGDICVEVNKPAYTGGGAPATPAVFSQEALKVTGAPPGVLLTYSGSAIAGVLGHKTVQYDLCGDAVNTAARMCAYSLPGHVHISEVTHELVRDRFSSVCRGERAIKGKGSMRTHFLLNMPADQPEISLQHHTPVASGLLNA